jgi:hypothetical protein
MTAPTEEEEVITEGRKVNYSTITWYALGMPLTLIILTAYNQ